MVERLSFYNENQQEDNDNMGNKSNQEILDTVKYMANLRIFILKILLLQTIH